MDESAWNAIYEHLSWKETDELVGYWQRHDEEEWTAAAFEVMEKILIERLGKLPNKEEIDKLMVKKEEPDGKANLFAELKTLIDDNDPVFYDPDKLTLLIKWVFRSPKILIVLLIIQFIFTNLRLVNAIFGQNYSLVRFVFDFMVSLGGVIIEIAVILVLYKALGYVLKMLKEMEINSRNP